MKFEVYCDESRPDLLCSRHPTGKYMVIGSLWLKAEDRLSLKQGIHQLRDRHHIGGEFKWQKISPSKLAFYKDLVGWFNAMGDRLRFRCIAVDHEKVNLVRFHQNDQELGFYKFYYQMLHHWILDFNEYAVFCDFKRNRSRDRLPVLQRCLDCSNFTSQVTAVQAIPSHESVLIQLTDVLTGAAAARLNDRFMADSAKFKTVCHLEQCLGRRIQHTYKAERKFNIFVIDLRGGW